MKKLSEFFGFEPVIGNSYILLLVQTDFLHGNLVMTHMKCTLKNEYIIKTSKGDIQLKTNYWKKYLRVFETYGEFDKAVVRELSGVSLENVYLRRFPYTKGYLKKLIKKYPDEYL
jgi:hypothetical protein